MCLSFQVLELHEQLLAELLGIVFQLSWLNFVVVRSIHLAEYSVNEVVGDGQVDVVLFEELGQELAQLFAVEVAILVGIKIVKVLDDFSVQVCRVVVESLKLLNYRF